jgi:hypothetical protein
LPSRRRETGLAGQLCHCRRSLRIIVRCKVTLEAGTRLAGLGRTH